MTGDGAGAGAHRAAHECDPVSAFGGVIAANREVSVEMAEQVAEIFTEVIIAPDYDEDALQLLQTKKDLRILKLQPGFALPTTELKRIKTEMIEKYLPKKDSEN